MTSRSIDSRFWSDGWIRKLNALDRYLFLYLLTNTHSTWCGVYELDLAMMAFESGIDKEDLVRSILPRLEPKAIYVDGWVYVPNWMRYHLSSSGTVSPQHKKGFDAAWSQVPQRIRDKIKEIEKKGYPMVGVSPSSSAFSSTSIAIAENGELRVVSETEEIQKPRAHAKYPHSKEVFSWFPNPQKSWMALKNVQEREYAEYLYERGEERVKKLLAFCLEHRDSQFIPQWFSPSLLEKNWLKLTKYANENR